MEIRRRGWLIFGAILALGAARPVRGAGGSDALFTLPAGPPELVNSESLYGGFAGQVRAEVEQLLGDPAALDDAATLHRLLALRVHLALHFHDERTAVATAAWIRTLQKTPASRALAGITTFALVDAQRRHPRDPEDSAVYRVDFERAFRRLLSALPHTPAIAQGLLQLREKTAGATRTALLAQVRALTASRLAGRTRCGLVLAEQLVRIEHELTTLAVVRDEMLRALDAAIAARTTGSRDNAR